MSTSLAITDSAGTDVYTNTESLRRTISETQVGEYFVFWAAILPLAAEPGQYTAELTLEDQLTGQTAQTTATFALESAEYSRDGQQFLDTIESELDLVATGLAENDGVGLRYETPLEISTDDAESQIGYIAGIYAGLIDQGWTVERLVSTVTDGNGNQYRFRVNTATARAFMNDQITADQYATEVLNSLVER